MVDGVTPLLYVHTLAVVTGELPLPTARHLEVHSVGLATVTARAIALYVPGTLEFAPFRV